MIFIGWAGLDAARTTQGEGRGVLEHSRQRQKGVGATGQDTDIRNMNCDHRNVNKRLACRSGSEYELNSFKAKRYLENM
jgi:hypothetical protein